MFEAEEILPLTTISATQLAAFDADLTLAELHDTIAAAWADIRSGISQGGKAVMTLPEDEFWTESGFAPLRQEFEKERLGWKLSSLYSVNRQYAGVKIIGANAFNRRLGLPRSVSTFLLLDKYSLRPIAVLDATRISAARTGTYASEVFSRFLLSQTSISVFIFGTGPIAEAVVASLCHCAPEGLARILIKGGTFESAQAFVKRNARLAKVPLTAVDSNRELRDCRFIITCTNARCPVFEDDDLDPSAVSLHLGGNEVPDAYFQRVLRSGFVGCDDIQMVSRRGSQSLPLFFARHGLTLEACGPLLGVGELSSPDIVSVRSDGPSAITCVGLPMLDLYAAAATYEKFLQQTGEG
jgi:ornithine cyclodeaminase/alanine dehydrogenase-like protein (mu-crystallin family)